MTAKIMDFVWVNSIFWVWTLKIERDLLAKIIGSKSLQSILRDDFWKEKGCHFPIHKSMWDKDSFALDVVVPYNCDPEFLFIVQEAFREASIVLEDLPVFVQCWIIAKGVSGETFLSEIKASGFDKDECRIWNNHPVMILVKEDRLQDFLRFLRENSESYTAKPLF